MGQYRLRTGITAGRIDDPDHGTFEVRDSTITVEDYDIASTLVNRYTVEWEGEDPGPPTDDEDDDEDGDGDEEEDGESTGATIQPVMAKDEADAGDPDGDADDSDAGDTSDVDDDDEADASAEDDDGDDDLCGATMSSGDTCDRLAEECPYH